ncbi:MLO-like protein 4, partial [Mucuna pruriens]
EQWRRCYNKVALWLGHQHSQLLLLLLSWSLSSYWLSIQSTTLESSSSFPNETTIPKALHREAFNQCGECHEPFVSYEGLEQLHRFLFILGITRVLYSCFAVDLVMSKVICYGTMYNISPWHIYEPLRCFSNINAVIFTIIFSLLHIYSWCRWKNQAKMETGGNLQGKWHRMKIKVMRRQTTFVFHHTSHPWSRSSILNWMLCFLRQFRSFIQKLDYLALRLGFIIEHKLSLSYNFYKYMVQSMEDEFHGILGIRSCICSYFLNCSCKMSFEMARFIWTLWGFQEQSCFMRNHYIIIIQLASK